VSFDVQVWSVRKPDAESLLAKTAPWTKQGNDWQLQSRQWQIVCTAPDNVLPEDLPDAVSLGLPGISFLTNLSLEPLGSSEAAKKELFRVATALAKASHGLVYDCQTDEISTPAGVKRFVPAARSERFALLELGWWFLGEQIFSGAGLDRLLDLFSKLLPEALPRRYGLYEPPQHQLADEGRAHLSEFLLKHLEDLPVLYASRPVMGLSFSCTKQGAHPRLGFRCNRISIEIEATTVNQPGWQEGLQRFWLAMCRELSPFYAEARTLNGFVRMGATYSSDIQTEIHPIRSWFWRGIPRELGHAIAIGKPYADLWPLAENEAQVVGDLLILDTGKWVAGNNLVLAPPEGIRQLWTPTYENVESGGRSIKWVTDYLSIWPFGNAQL
jgi:hypothetical protein